MNITVESVNDKGESINVKTVAGKSIWANKSKHKNCVNDFHPGATLDVELSQSTYFNKRLNKEVTSSWVEEYSVTSSQPSGGGGQTTNASIERQVACKVAGEVTVALLAAKAITTEADARRVVADLTLELAAAINPVDAVAKALNAEPEFGDDEDFGF